MSRVICTHAYFLLSSEIKKKAEKGNQVAKIRGEQRIEAKMIAEEKGHMIGSAGMWVVERVGTFCLLQRK